mmetsp:Transcript_44916/g.82001  ORF Transcript_44916/g.82001 Transcript_44916/m.82001 type:complete len:670 (-) Transcript_44916:127-2136(-)
MMDLIDGADTTAAPPPQHDLNVVYRPDMDGLGLREAAPEVGADSDLMDVLGVARQEGKKEESAAALLLSEPLVPDQQAAARPAETSVNLLDSEPASVNLLETEPPQRDTSGGQAVPSLLGGLENTSTVSAADQVDQLLLGDMAASPAPRQGWQESTYTDETPTAPRGVIDLSAPSSAAPSTSAAPAVAINQAQPSAPAAAGKDLSAFNKTAGFGSQDLFPEDQPKSESQQVLGQFVEMLPEQVKTQLAAAGCALPEAAPSAPAPAEAAAPSSAEPGASTEEHERKALERAVEGRWVPTYMRQQLQENGHTELPSRPNAHEYSANQPPPSLADAFQGMGEDLGEGCQNLIQYIMAVLSTCAFHCQMCTEHAASTAHEQAIYVQENGLQGLCMQAGTGDGLSDVPGRLPDEESSGFGPIRSRWRRHMQVGNRMVTFKRMLEISKTMLTGDSAPAQFGRVVQARRMTQHTFYREATIETCTFVSEVNTDLIPNDVLQHVCSGAARCQEKWFVEVEENRAQVEITNDLAQGMVLVILRMDITAESPTSPCEVDSRLYVRSQNRDTPLPVGLMERLIEAHTIYSESLRELIVSLAAEDESQLPVVRWQQPDRAPSWAAEGPRRPASGIGQSPPPEVPSKAVGGLNLGMGLQDTAAVGVEKSMLMQMADGIGQGI